MKSEGARVLQFLRRPALDSLSPEEAEFRASSFLAIPLEQRTESDQSDALAHPDVLMSICRLLRVAWDDEPARVAAEATAAYQWIDKTKNVGFFDERDYFLGELALIAGTACRHLGQLDEAEIWLDRAEASLANTINPGPSLANIRYARVGIHYSRGKLAHVIDMVPALADSFERFGMPREWAKCRFALASALKALGRRAECLEILRGLHGNDEVTREASLLVLVKLSLAEMLLADGQTDDAGRILREGIGLLDRSKPTLALANFYGVLAEALTYEGRLADSADAYRSSIAAYKALCSPVFEAIMRLALAENLLTMGEHRQAEWEVLAALPAIDSQKLEPHALVAVALLAKSARARRTDPTALSELRGYLRTSAGR
jgi:tetratricopeptide (TPR) repeat protein